MFDINAVSEKSSQSPPADNLPDLKEKSGLVSRNVTIGTHRTSVRLEPAMWSGLQEIGRREHVSIHAIATVVAIRKAAGSSLTAAIRVFVMAYFRMATTEDGHNSAGHGPGGAYMRSLTQKCAEEQDKHSVGTAARPPLRFQVRPHN